MATPPPPTVDLCTILSESKRIINAHSRHFLALSVLFLLPLAFAFSAYPAIKHLFFLPSTPTVETHLSLSFINPPPPASPTKTLLFTLLYLLFVFIFTQLAVGSITYSVFHGFYGRPVKLLSAIKSAFTSFLRLASTTLVSELIVFGFTLILALILFGLIKATQVLGFHVDYTSPYVLYLFLAAFLFFAIYLQVNWTVAYVVAVVESSWGVKPLKRSNNLVKGLKWVAFKMYLFYALFGVVLAWLSIGRWSGDEEAAADEWKSWEFVISIVTNSTLYMLILLSNLAANTVFYMYSKAIHGELAWEIAEEFAREYVSLPFDDGKVPHLVSVAYP